MIPIGIASGILGTIQTIGGIRGLKKMGDRPEFSIGEDVNNTIDMLKDRSRMGLAPTQKAAMWDDVTRGENAAFANARNLGGNNVTAAAVAAGTGANLRARMNIGVQDVMAQERHLADMLPWIRYKQGLLNNISADRMKLWDRKAQEYGRAVQSGLNNVANMFNLNQMMGAGGQPGAATAAANGLPQPDLAPRFSVPSQQGELRTVPDMPYGPVRTDWTPAAGVGEAAPAAATTPAAVEYLRSILSGNN